MVKTFLKKHEVSKSLPKIKFRGGDIRVNESAEVQPILDIGDEVVVMFRQRDSFETLETR